MQEPKKAVTFSEMVSQNKGIVISWLLGNLLMIGGIISIVIAMFNLATQDVAFPEDEWMVYLALGGFASFVLSWFVKIPLIVRKYKTKRAWQLRAALEAEEFERQRLEKIRRSMTAGEWELYQVQLENQKLLQDIKNKPATASGSRAVYGFVSDIGD